MGGATSIPEKIYIAASRNDARKLQALVTQVDPGSLLQWTDKDGRNALMEASKRANYAAAYILLMAGANVHGMVASTKVPGTALHEAVAAARPSGTSHEALVALLLDTGAMPFVANMEGETAVDIAVRVGNQPLLRLLERSALFKATLKVKVKSSILSKEFKTRWVVITPHYEFHLSGRSPPPPTRLLWIYKSVEATYPLARISLDGAHAAWAPSSYTGIVKLEVSQLPPEHLWSSFDGGQLINFKPLDASPACVAALAAMLAVIEPSMARTPIPTNVPNDEERGTLAKVLDAASAAGDVVERFFHSIIAPAPPSPPEPLRPAQSTPLTNGLTRNAGPAGTPPRAAASTSALVTHTAAQPMATTLPSRSDAMDHAEAMPGESDEAFAARLEAEMMMDAFPAHMGPTLAANTPTTRSAPNLLYPPVDPIGATFQTPPPAWHSNHDNSAGGAYLAEAGGGAGSTGHVEFSPGNPFAQNPYPEPGAPIGGPGITPQGHTHAGVSSVPSMPELSGPTPPPATTTSGASVSNTTMDSHEGPPLESQRAQRSVFPRWLGGGLGRGDTPLNYPLVPPHGAPPPPESPSAASPLFSGAPSTEPGASSSAGAQAQANAGPYSTLPGGPGEGPSNGPPPPQQRRWFDLGGIVGGPSRGQDGASTSQAASTSNGASTSAQADRMGADRNDGPKTKGFKHAPGCGGGTSTKTQEGERVMDRRLDSVRLSADGASGSGTGRGSGSGPVNDDDLCVICLAGEKDAGFLHGTSVHRCVCTSCAKRMKPGDACPICRARIEKVLMVF